jgi:hypothetical protein
MNWCERRVTERTGNMYSPNDDAFQGLICPNLVTYLNEDGTIFHSVVSEPRNRAGYRRRLGLTSIWAIHVSSTSDARRAGPSSAPLPDQSIRLSTGMPFTPRSSDVRKHRNAVRLPSESVSALSRIPQGP